ncbi:hypothetical protein M426DRAFT_14385 [Hypoxylon sp. CI-4A]|nr:hypothetical protein M426DRAFT_14385 [Hypoxylon sp. CI-4A]
MDSHNNSNEFTDIPPALRTNLPAEDDEIPLDVSSEESQSDTSMSDSDDEMNTTSLISTGNERFTEIPRDIPKKRKPSGGEETLFSTSLPIKRPKFDKGRHLQSTSKAATLDKSRLPAEIWHRIFTFTPPEVLINLLRTNKLFNVYLDPTSRYQCKLPPVLLQTSATILQPNAIWRLSRRRFWRRMPAPLQKRTELDMWRLACGKKCHFCGKSDSVSSLSSDDQQQHSTQPLWAFALRSCRSCLEENTMKEIDLILSSSVPSILMPALPFVLTTKEMNVISPHFLQNGLLEPPPQVTKRYLTEHIDMLKEEFLTAKSLGGATVEEWLKGLEARGKELLGDAMRWEKWASIGGVVQMKNSLSLHSVPSVMVPSVKEPISADNVLSALSSRSSSSRVASQHAPDSNYPITTTGASQSKNDARVQTLDSLQYSRPPSAPRARTREEALGLKAARRAEIERRAMELSPPLLPNVLARIPSFQAAIQIISPLDDSAWDLLKPRLLAQRTDAEQFEQHESVSQPAKAPEKPEGPQTEEKSVITKQLLDKNWDDVQAPLRAKISSYADEIIQDSWSDGQKITTDNSPRFAAEVLLHVRKRFYLKITQESAAARTAGREPVTDPPEGPFTQKLTLENMKWIFDVKIKPYTESHRKDLFFCNGCEVNVKAFGFEGVIQHYAAKHTKALSLGSVVVHWRAEWPETQPFKPDPQAVKIEQPSTGLSHRTSLPQSHAVPNHQAGSDFLPSNPASFQPASYLATPPGQGPLAYGLATQQSAPYVQNNFYVPQHHDYNSQPPHPFPYAYAGPQSPLPLGVGNGRLGYPPANALYTHNYNAPQYNSQVNFQNHYPESPTADYQAKLDYLAKNSRDLWTETAGLKELPGDIRVSAVIYHVMRRFWSTFSTNPALSIFNDGLSNRKEMRPVRNVNGLVCKACHLGLDGTVPYDQGRKTFSLPQLVNHFQQRHVNQPQATGSVVLDWTVNMVHTPDLSVLSRLPYTANVDKRKRQLIVDAFPSTPDFGGYSQQAASHRFQDARVDVGTTSYGSQQPHPSEQLGSQSLQYNHLPLNSPPEQSTSTISLPDALRGVVKDQNPRLNHSTASHTPLIPNQKPQQGASHGSNEIKPKKHKGNAKDYCTTSGQSSRSRKGIAAVDPAGLKSEEPNDDLITEERRQEEQIRAMWATERKETATRLALHITSSKLTEPSTPKAVLKAENSDGYHTQATQVTGSPYYSAQVQGHQQPVAIEEDEDDDLMAGLETQLDQQRASASLRGYKLHNENLQHEQQASYGQYVGSSKPSYPSQGLSYEPLPSGPPYTHHPSMSLSGHFRQGSSRLVDHDALYDQRQQDHYHAYGEDTRARQPSAEYPTVYERILVRDPRGDYYVERPLRLETGHKLAHIHGERVSNGDAPPQYRTLEDEAYASTQLRYQGTSDIKNELQQPTYEADVRSEGLTRRPYELLMRQDPAGYEEYDPRFPAAPPSSSTMRQTWY